MFFPKATIGLAVLLVFFFAVVSGGTLFPEQEKLSALEFSLYRPLNFFTYVFAHSGYHHLIGNLAILVAAGIAVEASLGKKHLLTIFFLGAGFSAIGFVLLKPEYSVIGSSAGAISLFTAGLLAEPKKTAAAIIISLLIGTAAVSAIDSSVEVAKQGISTEVMALAEKKEEAVKEKNFAEAEKIGEKILEKQEEADKIEKGVELRISIPPAFEIHVIAALFGALYTVLFCRKEFWKSMEKIHGEIERVREHVAK